MKPFDPKKIRALILDMDGVLWRGSQPIGDLPAIFAEINRRGWKAILATNNATRSPAQFLERLAGFGVHLEHWQVINSAQAAAQVLHEQHPQGGPVFIVGEEGLARLLGEKGFYHAEQGPLAVIAGLDRGLNYEKLRRATLLIRSGVPFIGTNPDKTFPTPEGQVPGAGALLALLEAASGVSPTIIGKPNPAMYRLAMQRLGASIDETLAVGDRLETDIAGAQALGCPCALVLSGVSSLDAAKTWQPAPDLIASDLSELLTLLPEK